MDIVVVSVMMSYPDGDKGTYNLCGVKNAERGNKITKELNRYWEYLRNTEVLEHPSDEYKDEGASERKKVLMFNDFQDSLISFHPIEYEEYSDEVEFFLDTIKVLPELDDKLDTILNV